jgi:integrase
MTRLEEAVSQVRKQQQQDINSMRVLITGNYPNTVMALHIIDNEYTRPKRRKGFSLIKVESKKHGFLWYARFSHNGKMLPTKWNTHTNDPEEAAEFARENKARLVEGYLQKQDGRMYAALECFYEDKAGAAFNDAYSLRLSERCRKEYHAVMRNKFVPFLKREKITCFEQLGAMPLSKFQDHLLAEKMKPQTVNNNLKAVKRALASLARKGALRENPGDRIRGIPVNHEDRKARGCYELDKLKGVFNRRWEDETSRLLCLLIYATGMRNGEINRMRLEDVISIEGCRFIQVRESKTPSGVRLVPLHEFAYRRLKAWAAKGEKTPQTPLFGFRRAGVFIEANSRLRERLGVSEAEAEAENITFYSGRHFWKTLMNSEGLGDDIEEIFMGHKVSGDVAKLYNHRDKRGKEMMARKAKQAFAILDRRVFN